MHSGVKRNNEGKGAATLEWVGVTDIEVKQTGREGSWHTVDIQTSFYLIFVILDSEVAPIQFPNCADWHSKHLSVCISRFPPPGTDTFWCLIK